jgi:hypothetical protein
MGKTGKNNPLNSESDGQIFVNNAKCIPHPMVTTDSMLYEVVITYQHFLNVFHIQWLLPIVCFMKL